MARIRTIKPEFWSSEQVMESQPMARLLFIGLWNFCDDGGNHPLAPRTIKALVFPGDSITSDEVNVLLGELEGVGLTRSYIVDGKHYVHVVGWKHQKIEKKNFKYPAPPQPVNDLTPNDHQPVSDESSNGRRPIDPVMDVDVDLEGNGEDQHNSHGAHEQGSPDTEGTVDPKVPSEMSLDWIPDDKLLKAYAFRTAIPVSAFTNEATASFVCHYSASGRFETQASWVSLLVKWVKRDTATASNVRQFPMKKQVNGPDFDDNAWANDMGDL
jgi:hypothetical protein